VGESMLNGISRKLHIPDRVRIDSENDSECEFRIVDVPTSAGNPGYPVPAVGPWVAWPRGRSRQWPDQRVRNMAATTGVVLAPGRAGAVGHLACGPAGAEPTNRWFVK
jgi:hypothetical protein